MQSYKACNVPKPYALSLKQSTCVTQGLAACLLCYQLPADHHTNCCARCRTAARGECPWDSQSAEHSNRLTQGHMVHMYAHLACTCCVYAIHRYLKEARSILCPVVPPCLSSRAYRNSANLQCQVAWSVAPPKKRACAKGVRLSGGYMPATGPCSNKAAT